MGKLTRFWFVITNGFFAKWRIKKQIRSLLKEKNPEKYLGITNKIFNIHSPPDIHFDFNSIADLLLEFFIIYKESPVYVLGIMKDIVSVFPKIDLSTVGIPENKLNDYLSPQLLMVDPPNHRKSGEAHLNPSF